MLSFNLVCYKYVYAKEQLVSCCSEPSQPLGITSGLMRKNTIIKMEVKRERIRWGVGVGEGHKGWRRMYS